MISLILIFKEISGFGFFSIKLFCFMDLMGFLPKKFKKNIENDLQSLNTWTVHLKREKSFNLHHFVQEAPKLFIIGSNLTGCDSCLCSRFNTLSGLNCRGIR